MLQGEHRTSKSNWGSSLRNNIALSVGEPVEIMRCHSQQQLRRRSVAAL